MKQIKTTEIAKYRKMHALKSKYLCPICGAPLKERVALDHCHATGMLRATLCGQCNRAEGKVKSGAQYMAPTNSLPRTDYIQYLENLINYLKYHRDNPSNIIHPSFDLATGKQKPVKRKRRIKPKTK